MILYFQYKWYCSLEAYEDWCRNESNPDEQSQQTGTNLTTQSPGY